MEKPRPPSPNFPFGTPDLLTNDRIGQGIQASVVRAGAGKMMAQWEMASFAPWNWCLAVGRSLAAAEMINL